MSKVARELIAEIVELCAVIDGYDCTSPYSYTAEFQEIIGTNEPLEPFLDKLRANDWRKK